MKITCNREKLLQAFSTVATVAPSRSPKPILQNVKLEVAGDHATLMATDLELGIRHEVLGVEVESPGEAILSVSRFGAILRECACETFHITADEKGITVRADRSEFKLPAEDPNEFPQVASFNEESYFEVSARLLKELIKRTLFATDNESSRYALGGIKLEYLDEQLIAVGTDGRRLSKMQGPVKLVGKDAGVTDSTIIPSRAMQLLERAISGDEEDICVAVRENEALIKTSRLTISARLLEGRFPRWRDAFPQRTSSKKIELSVGSLASAVRQAAIVTSDESRGVNFTFADGNLVLSGQTAEVGQSRIELPISYTEEELVITLDPKFVLDFLKVFGADGTFTLDLDTGDTAAVCTTEDGYGYVIMPLARDRA